MNIYYFIDEKGNNPVKEFINNLSHKEQAKIFAYIEELKKQGYNLRRPLVGYLGDGVYELRPRNNRIFYFFFLKDKAVLIHCIKKKTDKIPTRDLELCKKRKLQVERNKKIDSVEKKGDRHEKD